MVRWYHTAPEVFNLLGCSTMGKGPWEGSRRLLRRQTNQKHNWKRRGVKFKDRDEAFFYLSRSEDALLTCPVTGVSNSEHSERFRGRLVLDHCHITGRPRHFISRPVNDLIGDLENGHLTLGGLKRFVELWESGFFKVK